jgi:3-oxoacyl-[acyl-carrier protein] reductase
LIDLAGRRVLVTGGSRGIGAACCRLFARAGAAVTLQYRRDDVAASALLAELRALSAARSASGVASEHHAVRCDLGSAGAAIGAIGASRASGAEALVAEVARHFGGLDVLVNNAGIWVPNPLAQLDPTKLEDTLAINVTAAFRCAAAALPLLSESADGCIINVTSTAGQRGEALYSDYAASKGAMISATKSWAVELAPRVRVNSVAPGWVDTDMTAAELVGDGRQRALATIPLRRIATAEDVAGPIVFLASGLARHITGEVLNVNGGSVLAG